jgi:hypothetical protein
MDAPETSRRRFDLPSITIRGFLVLVACFATCFVAWKREQAARRDEFLSDLKKRGALLPTYNGAVETAVDEWSSDWPFHNVRRVEIIWLVDGMFSNEDVRRLKRAFPGAEIYRLVPAGAGTYSPEYLVPE